MGNLDICSRRVTVEQINYPNSISTSPHFFIASENNFAFVCVPCSTVLALYVGL